MVVSGFMFTVRNWNFDCQISASARAGVDAQGPAQNPHALRDSAQSVPERVRFRSRGGVRVESTAVVPDGKRDDARAILDYDRGFVGGRMFYHVVNRLLHDAVNVDFR